MTFGGPFELVNNLIGWNEAAFGGGGVDAFEADVTFDSNDAFGNLATGQPANYAGVADPTGSGGNVSVDPLLADEHPTFEGHQPRTDSPLVERGSGALAPTSDLRGLVRPLDGDANGNARVDIGARENEGLTRLRFTDATHLAWDPIAAGNPDYNLYRGDLAVLRASDVYVQDAGAVAGARRWCGMGTPTQLDTDLPAVDQVFFYLATGVRSEETSLGYASDLTERPFSVHRCP